MQALAVYENHEMQQAQQITGTMFADFVAWIDRTPKTTRTYLTNLKQFAAWMFYTDCRAPQRADIISYREYLTHAHDAIRLAPDTAQGWEYRTDSAGNIIRITCAANTARQYLRSVCQFFKWTAANGLYPDIAANVHAPKVDSDTHRKDALQIADVERIEQSIERGAADRLQAAGLADKDRTGKLQRTNEQGKRLYAIYLLSVNCGLRTVEISRANVKDFTTRGGRAWLYVQGKGKAEATQKKALAPDIAAAVSDYLQSRSDHYTAESPLFVATGNRSGGKRLATTTISTMLKKALQDAGYNDERITAHSLRHTAGNAVLQMTGNNIYEAQKYMRHSNPKTTEIYMHTNEEELDAQTADRLYDLYHGRRQQDADRLQDAISRLTPEQITALTQIAAAM